MKLQGFGYINDNEIIRIRKTDNKIYVETDRGVILATRDSCYVESPFFDFCLEPHSDNRQSERKTGKRIIS